MMYLTRRNVALLDKKVADAAETPHTIGYWCAGYYQVSSRTTGHTYWVETFYNKATGEGAYTCECQAFSFGRMCWHVGAVVLFSRKNKAAVKAA